MQIGTFRKNVMKTVGIKPAKMGLKQVSRNTARTNLVHATVALNTSTGRLIQELSPYVLGIQFTSAMQAEALREMGDIGYALTILCRTLKVKMPTATKKSKLVGTRTAAILKMAGLANSLLQVVETGTFQGPQMTTVTKSVALPNKGGVKEDREVEVVNTEVETEREAARQAEMKFALAGFVDVYWKLCFDIFKQPPSVALADKFARLQIQFPSVEFDLTEAPEKAETGAKTAELAGAAQ